MDIDLHESFAYIYIYIYRVQALSVQFCLGAEFGGGGDPLPPSFYLKNALFFFEKPRDSTAKDAQNL